MNQVNADVVINLLTNKLAMTEKELAVAQAQVYALQQQVEAQQNVEEEGEGE